ncbi:cupin domain-containing protein [Dokdonella soli]|uniref:Cupin domain-containing protein n=1 Tax=Dokdonella soli TaxID=529810 RepID=A0ABN1IFN2_9GAMM
MNRPIINIADLDYQGFPGGIPDHARERFDGARIGQAGRALGARKLGYNVTVVPPGKRAFPFHCHRINEEMFFVIEGSGEIRIGGAVHAIRAGDVIACPPGGPESAHQIVNTSADTELRYLAVSTRITPEICEYPDSGKFGVAAEFDPDADGKPQMFYHLGRPGDSLGYWDGE